MWQSEVSIDIDVPVSEVYCYLADFPRHQEWAYARMAYLKQVTPGPIQVGSEFDAAETVPFKAVTHSRITALEPGSRVAWHAWWSRGSAFDWEFVLSESDGGTHLVQRTAWHTALLFAVLASRLAPPATNTSRESPQPRAHQGQPGRRRACIHAWSGTLEMTASAVSPPFLICELRRFCSGSPS